MRALCGAIIAAGALVGLGLAALGIGTRYQAVVDADKGVAGLVLVVVLLVISLGIGIAVAFLGLAFHHHRRHLEHLHRTGAAEPSPRVGV